jgi:hypothetical protein
VSVDFATHPARPPPRLAVAGLAACAAGGELPAPGVRGAQRPRDGEADLAEALEDELFALREHWDPTPTLKGAQEYLNDWAAPDKGWLRKFYKPGTDEAQFDLTPATEKAIAWLLSLTERPFVGTESRLLTLFALLEQISAGTEADPDQAGRGPAQEARRTRRRDRPRAGRRRATAGRHGGQGPLPAVPALARELLADFREVEHNFRLLDRKVREKIALWEGAKGALLDEIMGERDAIGDSDQGRSFRAFWDFLMSSRRQEELSERLDQVLALPAVAALKPEPRTRRVHHDWLEAGEHTQRTVASCRSSCAASWTTGPSWKTAASWTCCTASRARRWPCATRRPPAR